MSKVPSNAFLEESRPGRDSALLACPPPGEGGVCPLSNSMINPGLCLELMGAAGQTSPSGDIVTVTYLLRARPPAPVRLYESGSWEDYNT
jgi:hypothetical protein